MVALRTRAENGGASRDRTDDLKLAKLPLSQLSYGPDQRRRNTPARSTSSAQMALTTFSPEEKSGGPGKI
jgi:hypothetical protein